MNAVDLVDYIPQKVAADHAVDCTPEDCGDHISPVASVLALQAPKVSEEAWTFGSSGQCGAVLVDEGDERLSCDAILRGCPVPPAVGSGDGCPELLALQNRLLLPDHLHVVDELEEHHPDQHRQAVQVAGEPFVLPHDVPTGLDDAAELLRCGEREF